MTLPNIKFLADTVPGTHFDLEKWFPQIGISNVANERFLAEIKQQQASLDAIVNTTGYGKDLLAALSPMQGIDQQHDGRLQKYRSVLALRKNEHICNIIKSELDSNKYKKIVLIAWHRSVIVDLEERLNEFKPISMYAGQEDKVKLKKVKKFHDNHRCRVLICNVRAANQLVDFRFCNHMVFIETSWVIMDNVQAILRMYHEGQEETVKVRFFGLSGSADDKLIRLFKNNISGIVQELSDST